MSGQSWKQTVDDLSGPAPKLTLAYRFGNAGAPENLDEQAKNSGVKKLPKGVFFEREKHGAWDGTE